MRQIRLIQRAIFWASLPFVAVQAVRLRKRAPRFPAAEGDRTGAVGKGKPARLLCVGDSIIDGVGARTIDRALVGSIASAWANTGRKVHYQAIGRTGATSSQMIEEMLPLLRTGAVPRAELIVVSAGVNDITGLQRTNRWRINLYRMIGELREHSPEATIVFLGVPPLWRFPLLPEPLRSVIGLRARIFDRILKSVTERHHGVIHLPLAFDARPEQFSGDGYHPNEESYAMIGEMVVRQIQPSMPAKTIMATMSMPAIVAIKAI